MTPLIIVSRTSIEAQRLLIEHKAGVNARTAAGATALMAAAQTGKPDAVRILLEKGADVNARTKRHESALADAATAGNEETVRLLLDRGAEVNVQDTIPSNWRIASSVWLITLGGLGSSRSSSVFTRPPVLPFDQPV